MFTHTANNLPGQMLMANIATAHYGQRQAAEESNERRDKNRMKAQFVNRAQLAQQAQTAQAAGKGTLA
jgi:hypothetical protein